MVSVAFALAGTAIISPSAAAPEAGATAVTNQDQPQGEQTISAAAMQQIEALIHEKTSRTAAQQKIDSQLLYALKMSRGEPIAAGVQTLTVNVETTKAGAVVVDISGDVGEALLQLIEKNGANILISTPEYGSVRAELPLASIETIAASPLVRYIQPKQEAMTSRAGKAFTISSLMPTADSTKGRNLSPSFAKRAAIVRERLTKVLANLAEEDGATTDFAGTSAQGARASQGDVTHRADVARSRYNVTGAGVRIGVLSDGVIDLRESQATGDTPPDVTVLPGQFGQGNEGTAMLEIIHDLAPGAKLYFATAFTSIGGFANNIRALRTAGCDIIVDDVFYFAESVFQDGQAPAIVSNTNGGVVTQAVNDVTAAGAFYFSSAGNEGNLNDGTAGAYEGDFVNGGTLAIIGGAGAGPVHDFDSSAAVSQFDRITLGSGNPIVLQWSDPLGASANDYDLYILNAAGTALVAASTGSQTGTQDPLEIVGGGANVTNNRVVVAKFSGLDRFIHVNTFRGRLQFATFGQTHGHSSAANAFSVAATDANQAFPNAFTTSNTVETFESDGPRRLFFQPDGTPYTIGNFSSTGGSLRQKPDITAADGGAVTGVGGFPNPFFGTSAAAPHAAAIAGLIKQAVPGITLAQLRTALNSSALDIEAPGVDRDSGAGIIMADTALQFAGAAPVPIELGTVTTTEVSGNGNTFVEPGEKGSLTVQLKNNSTNPVTGVSATLTSNTTGVTIVPPGTSAYPDIAASSSATNTTAFQYVVGRSVPYPTTISFTLRVTLTGAPSPQTFNVVVSLKRTATINTTLDAVVASNGEGFTAATNLQTGRLVRTAFGSQSTCGIPKAYPGINAADANVPHRYDAFTFTNTSTSPICVTITLTTSNAQAGLLQSVAYATAFNPSSVGENYLGDIAGNQANAGTRTYSVNVPANTNFIVVVNEVTGSSGSIPYTLTVDGLPSVTAVPPLSTIQFNPAAAVIPEASAPVNLTLTRTGDTTFPASVDYATADGTASSRSDYGKGIGTIQFAAGQTSASITVLLNEDTLVEGPETFTVTISNPLGVEAAIGAANVASVQITDNDAAPGGNSIDDSNLFVRQHYHDFLNREGDTDGITFWTNNIESCGANAGCREGKRIDTSAAFFLSIEFQETGYFTYLFYQASYGRRISSTVPLTFDEFIRDARKVGNGVIIGQGGALATLEANKQAFALEFVQRAEFLAVYPRNVSEAQFVDGLNTNTGNALTTAERNALVAELSASGNSDAGRAGVLRKVADNVAFRQAEFNRAFVLMEYFGYLRRNPNDTPDSNFDGFNFWLAKLNSFSGDFRRAEMVKAFITSAEYRKRFGLN